MKESYNNPNNTQRLEVFKNLCIRNRR